MGKTRVRPLNMKLIARSPGNVDLIDMKLNDAKIINETRQELQADVDLRFHIDLQTSEFDYDRLHFHDSQVRLEAVVRVFAYARVTKDDLLEIIRYQMKSFIPETYVLNKEVEDYRSNIIAMQEVLTGREINNSHDLYNVVDALLSRIAYEIELSVLS